MSYCDYVKNLPEGNLHKIYHDNHYGTKIENDDELFGRLILEINQAGLSWDTILKKEKNFRKAYSDFSIEKVASYGEKERERLLGDAGIIRNRLKIEATIYNAQKIRELQKEYGTFLSWIEKSRGKNKEEWVKIFKKNFKFVGGEIVGEFLMSIDVLPVSHDESCFRYKTHLK